MLMVVAGGLLMLETLGALAVGGLIWPAAFVTGGLYLILRALGPGRKPKPHR
jgi:hypothetical protein